MFNNTNVSKALEELTNDQLMRNFQCPPICVQTNTTVTIKCYHGPVHVAGQLYLESTISALNIAQY